MRIGFHLTPFWSPTDRAPSQILDEAIQVVAASSRMGYEWVSIGQHWMSYPSVWPQPFPLLARLVPETGGMQLKTSVILVPIVNPVELAETVATLDQLSHGRFVLGVSIGYRQEELRTIGLTRKDRVPKLEESLDLMKQLWTGEEVTFQGRYSHVERGRLGFLPYQKPHPPIEFGAQSVGATRRAARLGNGIFFGPQVAWRDLGELVRVYREACAEFGRPVGWIGASRSLLVGRSKEDAAGRASAYLEKTFAMYKTWQMQELTMAPLQLDSGIRLDDWTIHGSPADCVETIQRAERDVGLDRIGFTIYSLPRTPEERIDYLEMIAREIVAPVAAAAPR